MIDSVFRLVKNYYPYVFLEECKYIVQEKKMPKYITEEIEKFPLMILIEKILMKKIKYRMCLVFIFEAF